jgi:hypothetical protein
VEPDVVIGKLEPSELQSLVKRNGEIWEEIWLQDGDGRLVFHFEADSQDPQEHYSGTFEVVSQTGSFDD